MSRPRGNPALIEAAQREGTRQRLIRNERMPVERVDELLAAFEALPEAQGRPFDSEAAYRWVLRASPLSHQHMAARTKA